MGMMKNGKSDERGSTLVEVLAAFAVFMILMLLLLQSFRMALAMQEKSRNIREESERLLKAYYLGEMSEHRSDSVQEQETVLEFVRQDTNETVPVHAVVRIYRGEASLLYDVISEEKEEQP